MDRKEYIYYSVMRKATENDFISLDEGGLIMILEEKLGLDDDRMDDIMEYIYEKRPIPLTEEQEMALREDRSEHAYDMEMYRAVLVQALENERITEAERPILEALEEIFGISEDERKEMISQVKSDIESHTHRSLDERLSHFFGIE
ncbi:MAG: hypothetical protein QCI82_11730 [Candidatus Thermoplasmatota archaeon]|nr:hypothetical protein [Candidatus Thermoplasmatota archaeon]